MFDGCVVAGSAVDRSVRSMKVVGDVKSVVCMAARAGTRRTETG